MEIPVVEFQGFVSKLPLVARSIPIVIELSSEVSCSWGRWKSSWGHTKAADNVITERYTTFHMLAKILGLPQWFVPNQNF